MAFRVAPDFSSGPGDDVVLVVEYDGAYWHKDEEARDLLMAVDAPLERDQVRCPGCWKMARKVRYFAAKNYSPLVR